MDHSKITSLSQAHIQVQGNISDFFDRLRKRRGRAKILASANVMLKDKIAAKLVFVRDKRKKE